MSRLSVVGFASEVLAMQEKIEELEHEVSMLKWYEENYHDLMSSSSQHNQAMMSNLLKMAMTPGVVDALSNNAEK